MVTISMEDMQLNLPVYLTKVEAGETLVITRFGKPVAEVKRVAVSGDGGPEKSRIEEEELSPWGVAEGEFMESEDFDDPLPEDVLRLFEGEEE